MKGYILRLRFINSWPGGRTDFAGRSKKLNGKKLLPCPPLLPPGPFSITKIVDTPFYVVSNRC